MRFVVFIFNYKHNFYFAKEDLWFILIMQLLQKNKPAEVIDAVIDALKNFGNSSRGVYEESLSADRVVFDTRKKISKNV